MIFPRNIAISALALALTSTTSNAQAVSGILNAVDHSDYADVASQFRVDDLKVSGQTIYNGQGYLFCADLLGTSLDQDSRNYPRISNNLFIGTLEQMDVWDRFNNSQDEGLARATAHWFIDNYYESYFLNPVNDASARQYAFQNVIWEIFGDAGTSSGLNFNNGNIDRKKFGPYGSSKDATLWGYMNGLLSDVKSSGVTSGYEHQFEVLVALDSRSSHQDYLLLSANPSLMTIPEPSVAIFCASAMLLTFRRRRQPE